MKIETAKARVTVGGFSGKRPYERQSCGGTAAESGGGPGDWRKIGKKMLFAPFPKVARAVSPLGALKG